MVRQGVTTLVIGNCGESAAPSEEWPNFGAYLSHLEKKGVAVNVAALVGHGNLREVVLSSAGRLPSPEEFGKMKGILDQAMKDGAIGLSSALAYAPGMFADTNEMIELCKIVARYGGLYTTHIRSDGSAWEKSVREAIETSEKSGASLQISHLESHYPNWGQEEKVLRILEETRARGMDVTTDIPPYLCGQTGIYTLLPPWALDGGTPKIVERLKNAREREKIKEWIMTKKEEHVMPTATLVADGHPENIWIVKSKKNPACSGKNFAEIGALKGKSPLDAVLDVIAEEEAYMSIVMEHHFEEDMRKLIVHPLSMIETDGHALAPYGPLGEGSPHPRCYGTFPLLFRKYVRGETRAEEPREPGAKLLTLEEAVRKSTSFPAQKLGLRERGLIREGMFADIVIFDPLTITDKATYANPHQYPEGISYVLVNGEVVVEKGEHTGKLVGKILRGPGHSRR
jgi:N-acyl-D-aspartate/D-glutamate deacylase